MNLWQILPVQILPVQILMYKVNNLKINKMKKLITVLILVAMSIVGFAQMDTTEWNGYIDSQLPSASILTAAEFREVFKEIPRNANFKYLDVVNIKDYGATGDGVTDDRDAFQEAITYCVDNTKQLFVPSGTYVVGDTLLVLGALHMVGEGREFTKIEAASGITLFTSGDDTGLYDHLFIDIDFVATGGNSTLFDISFGAGYIERCGTNLWYIVFNRSVKQVTKILANRFYGIKGFLISNDATFTDVQISHNYISGYQPVNPICFGAAGITNVTVTHNYIDFFKVVFNADRDTYTSSSYSQITIANNTIEYVWRAMFGTISNSIIANNRFQHIDDATVLASFTNPDTDMTTGTAYAIYSTGLRAMTRMNITNNFFICNGIYLDSYIYGLNIRGNNYSIPDMNFGEFAKASSGTTIDNKIFIDFLHQTEEETLLGTNWENGNGVYYGREINYNDTILRFKPLVGNDGEWLDYTGNVVTE
jgi:hypothetical protein